MNWNKQPLALTVFGCLFIVVGAVGFTYHFRDIHSQDGFQLDGIWIEFVRLLAIVAGVFLLRRHNWARWLAVGWMGLHVILSAFNGPVEFAVHALFLVVISWFLFRPEVTRYLRS